MKTSPAQVGHFIEGGFMDSAIQAVDESFKVVGPAFTISLPTNDNAMLYYAMKQAPKGSVLVISRLGEDRFACCRCSLSLSVWQTVCCVKRGKSTKEAISPAPRAEPHGAGGFLPHAACAAALFSLTIRREML